MCFKVHDILFSQRSTIPKKIYELPECNLQTTQRALDERPKEDNNSLFHILKHPKVLIMKRFRFMSKKKILMVHLVKKQNNLSDKKMCYLTISKSLQSQPT